MFTIPHARRRTRWPLIGLLIAALAVPGWAADAAPEVVVFGTSLSDPGNAFALRGGTNAPPSYDVDPLFVPTSPYAYGGHHFTNGSTWIEQLGLILGFAEDVQPALASQGVMAANFAVGSARAREDGINVNLADQVDAYLQRTGGVADPDALYVIEMGGGDLRDAVAVLAGGGSPGPVLTDALLSIAQQTGLLYSRGARRFLVWNAPDISLTPAIRRLDAQVPGAAFAAAALTVLFNQGLDLVIGELSALPQIRIETFDAYQLLHEIVADPAAFGLSNVTASCITPDEAPFICQDPDAFLFWDGTHPTVAAHGIVAQRAAELIGQ